MGVFVSEPTVKCTLGIGFCVLLGIGTVALAAPPLTPQQEQDSFPDVPATHWARPSLIFSARSGIIKGDSKGHFNGNAPVTRRQLALILDRWHSWRPSPPPIPQWAKDQKTYLTRYEFAVALSRLDPFFHPQASSNAAAQTAASQLKEPLQDFPDVVPTHWAYSGARYVASLGIMEGDNAGRFHGDALLTRYELVVALMRAPTVHFLNANERK